MNTLVNISTFGAIDADNDDFLFDCFEDHEAFRDLLDFKKFLIIGRKGSGKTAIFRILLKKSESDIFTFGHTFSDYPWSFHDKQIKLGVPAYDKYTHSWKYLILLTLSKILLNQDQSVPHDDQAVDYMAKIERFVIDTYGTRDPDVTQIFTPAKKLRLKPTFELNFELLKAGISPESVPMEELPTIVQEVNNKIAQCVMASLNPNNRYYVCFDQLDLGFDPQDSEYANRLIGLLLACRDLNILAKDYNKKMFIAVFLRDDIYNNLHFEDKNKITQNFVSVIEWDTPRTSKTLKGLMEKRFTKVLSSIPSENIKWEDVFDETREMTGHQTKYQHLLDRTYLRPRDMIKYCNEILRQYNHRNASVPAGGPNKFENIDINNARGEYSHYFREELDDEIHKHIPGYENYFEIFKILGVSQFNKDEFITAFDKKKEAIGKIKNPTDVLKELFEFSVIGFYRAGGRGYGGSEYIFKYEDMRAQFDETAQRFRVHPGLIDILGLKKYSWKSEE